MIYFLFILLFLAFLGVSFQVCKVLLKTPDIMKYLFFVLAYIVGILVVFQGAQKLAELFLSPIDTEIKFMFLIYLLATMISFLAIAIVTIKKLKKK
ncbi:MAG: hypothetical protein LBT29_01195 [Flavobacteriaceae bacterium]|jgi:hypothetical protein|nr:hypothetical protein [Flavobacteriaceae bacterium]